MTPSRLLWSLVVLQAIGAAALLISRSRRPAIPLPALDSIDAAAAADIRALQRMSSADSAADWSAIADVYMAFGYYSEAERCYRRAATLGALRDYAFVQHRAICFDRLGDTKRAAALFREAAAFGDEQQRLLCIYNAGRNQLRAEDEEAAAATFRSIVTYPPACYQLAKILTRTGRFEEAATLLRQLEKSTRRTVETTLLRARVEQELGHEQDAARYLELAERTSEQLDLNVYQTAFEGTRIRYGVNRLCGEAFEKERSGDLAGAIALFEEALEAEWRDWIAPRIARLHEQLGNTEAGLAYLSEVIARYGAAPETLRLIGQLYLNEGRTDEAIYVWERACRMRPVEHLHRRLAVHYQQRGEVERARSHRALAEQTSGIDAYRSDRLEEAEPQLTRATTLDPELRHAWYYLGRTRRARGQIGPAREAFRRCLEIDPDHSRARAALKGLDG
jgi:tetratricopeptide (TPR) repeat protein